MPEKTGRDRRFRNAMYALILAVLAAYLLFKLMHVMVAVDAWYGNQEVDAGSLQPAR